MTASRAVVPIRTHQIAEPAKPKMSKAVAKGLDDLTIAFRPGRQQSEDDRTRWLQLCVKVLARFHHQLIADVCDWMLTNNAANPFCPTPQDIHAACAKRETTWRYATISRYGLAHGGQSPINVPDDAAKQFLQDHLSRIVPDLLDRGADYCEQDARFLLRMSDPTFATIPADAFPEGTHARVAEIRATYRHEEEERVQRAAAQRAAMEARRREKGTWI